MEMSLVGTTSNHQLSWNTTAAFFYHVDCSTDLEVWVWTGLSVPGTNERETYGFRSSADNLFYRIRATVDPNNGGFLVSPHQDDLVNQIDGVCFAFDLSSFSSLPSKIRILERDYSTGDTWTLIGTLTEFGERLGVKFVRGSAVWLPASQGEFEVQAAVLDSSGTEIASAIRRIEVEEQQSPTISITSGPPPMSQSPLNLQGTFQIDYSDTVRRVEFYDNNVLIGTATRQPFEEEVTDLQGESVKLLRGAHSIYVRGYDSAGSFGESDRYDFTTTGVNARPEIQVTSPQSGLELVRGDTFTIQYDPPTDLDGASDVASVVASRFIIPYADTNDIQYPEETIAEDNASPFTALTVDTAGWSPGTYLIKVVSIDASGASSYHQYFRVRVKTSAGATFAEDLLDEIADEQSVTVSNPFYVGREIASGIFQNGRAFQLQIDSGILLTTGDFAIWDDGDTGTYDGWGQDVKGLQLSARGDFDLETRVVGFQTQDAAALEFDVFCVNGQLEFEYQFGSEEYDEWIGEFNDSFMILVDGAVVTRAPGCGNVVSVNTINLVANRHLFFGDDEDIDPTQSIPDQIEYDGITHKLRAHVFLPEQTIHHVRIVIADVDDGVFDSGLFVETESLRTIEPTP
jgi:hypothetical protein